MSHHRFTTRLDHAVVTIIAGWNPSQQGYFMSITKKPGDDLHSYSLVDETLFNHLSLHTPYPNQINTLLWELENRGIELPAHMVIELLRDGVNNSDEKFVEHQIEDGRYLRRLLH